MGTIRYPKERVWRLDWIVGRVRGFVVGDWWSASFPRRLRAAVVGNGAVQSGMLGWDR
jgi:hypothetical protein